MSAINLYNMSQEQNTLYLLSIPILNVHSTLKISISNQQTQTFWMAICSCRGRINISWIYNKFFSTFKNNVTKCFIKQIKTNLHTN